jgi:hypothetical protein
MNAAAEPHPAGRAEAKPPGEGARMRRRWLTLIVLFFAAQVAFLFVFGARKPIAARPVSNVPILNLAASSSEWLTLNDPTLFAQPHPKDFAAAIRLQTGVPEQPPFQWTEAPQWLSLSNDVLGVAFDQFMHTNRFADFQLQLKPPASLSAPALPKETALAQSSALRVEGELARRLLSPPPALTNWPYANVIAPSKVQVLVDTAGNVFSAVLLPPDTGYTAADQYDQADQHALELARAMRFTPSPLPTLGRMIFNWHTLPPPARESETPPSP